MGRKAKWGKTMRYLNGKKVYLSGPIHALNDDGVKWRELITPRLIDFGIEVLDPCKKPPTANVELIEIGKSKEKFRKLILDKDWKTVKKEFWPIIRFDLRMVDHCDFIIFEYDTSAQMVGTIHELVVATFEKKVILLKYNEDQLKNFNPWIAAFVKDHHFFSKWDDMFEYLEKVNSGEFDTSLWVV
jgi:hypothetical protein